VETGRHFLQRLQKDDVLDLQDLAFIATYRSIVDHLMEIPANHKNRRQQDDSCDGDTQLSRTVEAGRHVCQKMRNQLSKRLSGQKNKEVRCKLLKHYNNEKESKILHLTSFLDVILDESLDEITASFDEDAHRLWNEEIMNTIVRRSPYVTTLHLYWQEKIQLHSANTFISKMSQLSSLTNLNLYQLPDQCKALTFLLGRSCPSLKRLQIALAKNTLSTDELIRIFYSGDIASLEEAATIPLAVTETHSNSSCLPRAYHRCHVSAKALHPFCQTLEEVRINRIDCENSYAIAFLLRHMPRLKELDFSDFEFKDYSISIRSLWDISDPQSTPAMLRCLAPHPLVPDGLAPLSLFDSNPDLILQTYFTGTLALVNLFLEGEVELRTLQSVCNLCPELNKLLLLETAIRATDHHTTDHPIQTEIKNYFSQLKKLRVFSCSESDGPLCTVITQATAPFLTTLEMSLDGDFLPKFDFLTECINLKVLKLSTEFHPPLKNYFNQSVEAATFLPKLEEIQLEFCMNAELEELFLQKSTLKHIDVLCLHHLGQNDDQLFRLFLQWPQLNCFKYKMPRKFTAGMWMKLLPHLPYLNLLSLYKDIKNRCSADYLLLKQACRSRHVQLELHLFLDTYLCVDGDNNDELISTSDESETES